MPEMERTEHYGLALPGYDDWGDVEILNENSRIIDATLAEKADKDAVVPNTRKVAGKALDQDVTLVPGDVGMGNVPNVATNDQTVTYTEVGALGVLVSGEKLAAAFGKLKKAVAELISHLANKSNPHGVTVAQIGADPAGSSAAVDGKLTAHTGSKNNPHSVTAAQVGAIPDGQKGIAGGVATLGADSKVPAAQLPPLNYDPAGSAAAVDGKLATHTGDDTRHLTAAERTAWNGKVDKEAGKGLSTNDYTSVEKTKLAGIATGANNYSHPSTHPASMITGLPNSLNFGASDGIEGLWDRSAAVPSGTQTIRYNGYLRATRVYGMYYSDSADYAEAYAVEGVARPGDLVMICSNGTLARNTVRANPCVVGIVSTDPASLIGVAENSGTPIAMAGRVPVRVVGEVAPGELLMGAEVPGALCAAETDAPRGAVVAQALEGKADSGEGFVLALIVRL